MKQSARAKRLFKQNQRLSQGSKLNLVALMDIFTILVFFLMFNQSDVKVLQSNKTMQLPASVASQLPADTLSLTVTPQQLVLQGQTLWQGDFTADPATWQEAIQTALAPALQAEKAKVKLDNLSSAQQAQLQQKGYALTVLGDAAIPYAALKHILAVAASSDYRDVALAVELQATNEAHASGTQQAGAVQGGGHE